jgi:3,4-dihydroxy 2-butanone 4-phosphate synthase/GTP cyclohydrolase II
MDSAPSAGADTPVPVREVAAVPLPTIHGHFTARAFTFPSGRVHLALTLGRPSGDDAMLIRLHSECLTGDVLGSLRCDCGVQLHTALRAISAEGRGVLLYMTGHEGRGIGLLNKLRSYLEQDRGADTVDANLRLGLPVDGRDYAEAAAILRYLGISRLRLLTNNPRKAEALTRHGIVVHQVTSLATAAHLRNQRYLDTKRARLGHLAPAGGPLDTVAQMPVDVAAVLGDVKSRPDRPYVIVKYAQTLDGRIATATGDSRWISGEPERRLSHALRAACDAVLVGRGTVMRDDPQLTVRMVPGASPLRVVLDSEMRTPLSAQILNADAPTVLFTRLDAGHARCRAVLARGAGVHTVPIGPVGLALRDVLAELLARGVASLLVEGGSKVITSLLTERVVDRMIVSISPRIIGSGVEAVGPLAIASVRDAIQLRDGQTFSAGGDLVTAWNVHLSGDGREE